MAAVRAYPRQDRVPRGPGGGSLTVAAGLQGPREAVLFLVLEHPNLGPLPVYNRCSRSSLRQWLSRTALSLVAQRTERLLVSQSLAPR